MANFDKYYMLIKGRSAGIRKADKTKYPDGGFFSKKNMLENKQDDTAKGNNDNETTL